MTLEERISLVLNQVQDRTLAVAIEALVREARAEGRAEAFGQSLAIDFQRDLARRMKAAERQRKYRMSKTNGVTLRHSRVTPVPYPATAAPSPDFLRCWEAYPTVRGTRAEAWVAWQQVRPPSAAAVLTGIEAWKLSVDWTKDGGIYTKAMAPWLRSRAWESPPAPAPKLLSPAQAKSQRTADSLREFLEERKAISAKP